MGGANFAGKTFALLLDAMRYLSVPHHGVTIFRRLTPHITAQGGLWDGAMALYPHLGGRPFPAKLLWRFPCESVVRFAHLERDDTVLGYDGSQIPDMMFDQLEQFTARQWWHMLGRNRHGPRYAAMPDRMTPRVRATCNPDPDSFLAPLLAWWIDQTTGYPIPDRKGVERAFLREGPEIRWARDATEYQHWCRAHAEDPKRHPRPLTLTFFGGTIDDNPLGEQVDPAYRSRLHALDSVERERRLHGNWIIRPEAGRYYQPRWTARLPELPISDPILQVVRAWDLAATAPTPEDPLPDATASVLLGQGTSGRWIVLHASEDRLRPAGVEALIQRLTTADRERWAERYRVCIPQDPGAAGKAYAQHLTRLLAGVPVVRARPQRDKLQRFAPFASQAEAGNVALLDGPWCDLWQRRLEAFAGKPADCDDLVDATSDAFWALTLPRAWS